MNDKRLDRLHSEKEIERYTGIGNVRRNLHSDQESQHIMNPYNEVGGLMAEFHVGELLGQEVDLSERKHGDHGKDFLIVINGREYKVDPKANLSKRNPDLLLVRKRVWHPDTIYIHVNCDVPSRRSVIRGWRWGKDLEFLGRWPTTVINYGCRACAIRDMKELPI